MAAGRAAGGGAPGPALLDTVAAAGNLDAALPLVLSAEVVRILTA
jgi:hypothetical protein